MAKEKEIKTIDDLVFDEENANQGTPRGEFALETSIRRLGIGRGIVADKKGVIIGGNKSLQKIRELGFDKIEIVHTTGDVLVVTIRDDLDLSSDDARAKELALSDNRVAELNLSWRTRLIEEWRLKHADLQTSHLFSTEELARAGEKLKEQRGGGGADGAKMVQCPKCGEKFTA